MGKGREREGKGKGNGGKVGEGTGFAGSMSNCSLRGCRLRYFYFQSEMYLLNVPSFFSGVDFVKK